MKINAWLLLPLVICSQACSTTAEKKRPAPTWGCHSACAIHEADEKASATMRWHQRGKAPRKFTIPILAKFRGFPNRYRLMVQGCTKPLREHGRHDTVGFTLEAPLWRCTKQATCPAALFASVYHLGYGDYGPGLRLRVQPGPEENALSVHLQSRSKKHKRFEVQIDMVLQSQLANTHLGIVLKRKEEPLSPDDHGIAPDTGVAAWGCARPYLVKAALDKATARVTLKESGNSNRTRTLSIPVLLSLRGVPGARRLEVMGCPGPPVERGVEIGRAVNLDITLLKGHRGDLPAAVMVKAGEHHTDLHGSVRVEWLGERRATLVARGNAEGAKMKVRVPVQSGLITHYLPRPDGPTSKPANPPSPRNPRQ